MSTTISIKASFGSDTRRIRLDAAADFKALVSALQPLYFPADPAAQFAVAWTDEDGDVVTVGGDADFAEAKRAQLACGAMVRLTVLAATPPPYPATATTTTTTGSPMAPVKAVKFAAAATTDPTAAVATAGPTKAFLSMLVDRSGSMGSLGGEVLSGIQTYLQEMKTSDAEDGSSTSVLMSTFDNTYELAHDGLDLPDALKVIAQRDIQPRGMTALWDGIGFILRDTEARIAALPSCDKPDKVIIFILTDGQENSSSTWSQATVKRRMDALKLAPHSYEFFFAAAGQDALATGSHMGLTADECVTWSSDAAATRETFKQSAVNAVRCKKGMSRAYTPQQRSACYTPQRSSAGRSSMGRAPSPGTMHSAAAAVAAVATPRKASKKAAARPKTAKASGSMFADSIKRAWYGDPSHEWFAHGAHGVDVTAQAKAAVVGGKLQMVASSAIAGDPKPGVAKVLVVEYRHVSGDHETETVNEGQRFNADLWNWVTE